MKVDPELVDRHENTYERRVADAGRTGVAGVHGARGGATRVDRFLTGQRAEPGLAAKQSETLLSLVMVFAVRQARPSGKAVDAASS